MRRSTLLAALAMCVAAVANLAVVQPVHAVEVGCKTYCTESCWAAIFACLINCDSGVSCEEESCTGVSGSSFSIRAVCNTNEQ
jgi:hypothetical protein